MRIEIMQTPLDVLSFDETVALAKDAMVRRRLVHQVSMNVAKLVNMRSDSVLRDDVLTSSVISADGMGIILAAKMLGRAVPERVSGIDLMTALLELCAKDGFRPYVLGARPDVVTTAVQVAQRRFPGLALAGCHDGYFSEADEAAIVAAIRASKADCLFIGMPTPRKERFMKRHGAALGVPFIMGVGGAIDILAGKISRAPLWMQRAGLEWAYRLLQEPRRMFWRYLRTNAIFAVLLVGELLTMRFSRASAA